MKIRLLFLSFCFLSTFVAAQSRLNSSRQLGHYTYIYRLTDQEMFGLTSEGKSVINDGFLHTLIDSFKINKKYEDKLPYGNYLYVSPIKNKLNYSLVDKRNVDVAIVNNQYNLQFYVKDLKGNLVSDARVELANGQKVAYNQQAHLYQCGYSKKSQVVKVSYQGVSNFFSFEINNPREDWPFFRKVAYSFPIKYTWQPFKNLFRKKYRYRNEESPYRGYLVFSKPKYKPLDAVKFKAYVVDVKGGAIKNKTADVLLYGYGQPKKIGTLNPYRDGGYDFSFILADSLKLVLDRDYFIELVTNDGKKNRLASSGFRYEDYELKSLDFKVRTDKTVHQIGSPLAVFMKATDENELAVPDGRVEIVAVTSGVSGYFDRKVFVPDTLWKKEMKLDPVGETKLILPDSIFPKANIDFRLNIVLRNSNNEVRRQEQSLSYRYQKEQKLQEIKGTLQKDSLLITYKENDQLLPQQASVVAYAASGIQLDSMQLTLPASVKANYNAEYYKVKLLNGFNDSIYLRNFSPTLSIGALQTKDSLKVLVNNENKVPFWYTVFSGNRILLQGYANRLDTALRHGISKAAHIRINYFWNGEEKNQEISTVYNPNYLNVKLIAPPVVYPGQEVKMLVKVTDIADKPVAGTDVTAQAFTAKFGNVPSPSLPDFSKRYFARKRKRLLEMEEVSAHGALQMDWQKWGRALGLDTIEYYKFTHPKEIYTYVEQLHGELAQLAPFVIENGDIDPVSILYIDEVPVYFSQAEQLQRYAFAVKPGTHSIRMRTATKMIYLREVDIARGSKKVISVEADVANTKAEVTLQKNVLTPDEASYLERFMIKITDNFQAEKTTLRADTTLVLLNPPPMVSRAKELLVGPFKENFLSFETKGLSHNFIKEPGYTYTFLPGLIKQKSYESLQVPSYVKRVYNQPKKPVDPLSSSAVVLANVAQNGNDNFSQYVLKRGEIDSIWNEYLNLRSYTTLLFSNEKTTNKMKGRLVIAIDTAFKNKLPYIKNIVVYKNNQPDFIHIYPGNTTVFPYFGEGSYRILFLLKDNRYFMADDVNIKANGQNYYEWKAFKIVAADRLSKELDAYIKAAKSGVYNAIDDKVLYNYNSMNIGKSMLANQMYGKVVAASDQSALPGASVRVVGFGQGTVTGADGQFSIAVPANGKIIVAAIGFESKEIPIANGNIGTIALENSKNELNEVVITGYGVATKRSLAMSSTTLVANELSGRVAGLSVNSDQMRLVLRGARSLPDNNKAMVVLDGVVVPYEMISKLNPEEIDNMSVLNSNDATAIYGAMAANGVILIKTKKGNTALTETGELVAQQQTMRHDFSDVGFWQPQLFTDENGNASFSVKFPDDITNWKTRVIAMNGNKQSGYAETAIKSFKTLSANFVSPLFAVNGDSIKVLGKLMNYTPLEEKMNRRFVYNGKELLSGEVGFKNAHIDTMTIAVNGKDSLNFEYTLKQSNGYFDGEIRKVPVVEAGVKETKGYFGAFLRDTTVNYEFDKKLGNITLKAEASVFPSLLDEMTKLRNYEYLCNEQLASKLKALLLEKKVRKYLGEPFTHEKDIAFILKKLGQNKRPEGTWGWWTNSSEEMWISLHVVEALLMAEKDGYPIALDKKMLYTYLVNKLVANTDLSQLPTVKLLYLLDNKNYIKDWALAIEKAETAEKPSLYSNLQLMRLKQMAGLKVDTDGLLLLKKQTMFGNYYWGEENNRFWDNSIQNTLLAYEILKAAGGHANELEKIQLYFLEQRKNGQWRNTYESSLILETILPEMLAANPKGAPATLTINQETVSTFPFSKTLTHASGFSLAKKGGMPIYFTAYQQFQNPKPEKVSKDFTVSSSFRQKGAKVKQLKAGTLATLSVEVEVRADADYVMIEIPIPAGCSYENKLQSFWGVETHREYFKEKTAIFCTKLKQGKYTFNIDLMPRYSGSYVLNPAKAEMMYFPVFFGREGMKKVGIN
ncbi:alpha-2-macroglobulin family protein [Pedobacter sp. KR3-3]|uniref:Alpha-2-macroglobulin family protein n=1 Tax=Pedobacter albus TaxID=3113905 RepID=A0ABU7I6D0_9SPHI|nr:alpha-2-macroglobulin family protein [Pedobacter sp. KR3-3]MEE1944929.1 alpha-2-macroglobulin family protein [Pedobacter sp. KR3-3]